MIRIAGRVAVLGALLCLQLPAPLIPGPNLAKTVELADAIVVARVSSGTTVASGSQVATDMVLHVDRVLKGNLIPGTEIVAHLEGQGYFVVPGAKLSAFTEKLFGIWFLSSGGRPYGVISRDGIYGELHFASVLLPEGAPGVKAGDTAAEAVTNEIAGALRWTAEVHGDELRPGAQRAGVYASQFRSMAEDFRTLNSLNTLAAYRQFAAGGGAPLRALGIRGLIEANDPEGVKLAAADWGELSAGADVQPLIGSLMMYSNAADADAVRALGALALRDAAERGLRENAAYALRAIHTKEALPALVALLDYDEGRVRPYALSGLCLYVRNAPAVTAESVPSMAWMQTRSPAPMLNAETEKYCLLGGGGGGVDLDAYVNFWRAWWLEYRGD